MRTPSGPSSNARASGFTARDRLRLSLLAALAFIVGLRGILDYGFVGQDFTQHRKIIQTFASEPLSSLYKYTNPPALYWLGSLIREHISPVHYLGVLSLCLLVLNVAALWILFGFIWEGLSNPWLRYSAALFLTLLPLRVIHSEVIAADAFTVPVFALSALLALKLAREPRCVVNWVGLSLCLTAGVLCKYTFSGVIAATGVALAASVFARVRGVERLRWAVVGFLSLSLPSEVLLIQLRESEVQNSVMRHVWLREGEPAVMGWGDLVLPKRADAPLLGAPRYFPDRIYEVRRYSYPGLLHLASVTDCMDLLQPPPAGIESLVADPAWSPSQRPRSPAAQLLNSGSAWLSLAPSVLAVAGSVLCVFWIAGSLVDRRWLVSESTAVLFALAAGFYLPVVLSLPHLNNPYAGAFWMPRLVLPAILVFYLLGFVALDRFTSWLGTGAMARAVPVCVAFYTVVLCAVFAGIAL